MTTAILNSSTAQSWIDREMYPFESQFLQLTAGKMHYIEAGEGDPILFVHGTPTWSFLYRDFVRALSGSHRCIAIDHLGFGLSEKGTNDFRGTPEEHSANLIEFISRRDLKNITVVVHDFGGPIGLAAAIRHCDRIKNIVFFNTWLWSTRNNPDAKRVDKLINSSLGRFLYLRLNFSPKVLLKKAFHDSKNLSRNVHQHYIRPFPDKSSRRSLYALAQALTGASDWYQQQWEALDAIGDRPMLFLWGIKDPYMTPEYLEKWKGRFPKAAVVTLECGHFVQEEATEASIRAIRNFLRE